MKKILSLKNIFFVLMFGATVMLLLVYTEKSPIIYLNEPFPLPIEKTFVPNETIRFVVERCATKIVPFTVGQSYVADDPNAVIQEFYLESITTSPPALGCLNVLGLPTKILPEMPTGSYRKKHVISIRGKYKDFIFIIYSRSFKVVNPHPIPYEPRGTLPFNKIDNKIIDIPVSASTTVPEQDEKVFPNLIEFIKNLI